MGTWSPTRAMGAHPGDIEVHPIAMEAHPGPMEAHPGAKEATLQPLSLPWSCGCSSWSHGGPL
jgi:hypothetical protein